MVGKCFILEKGFLEVVILVQMVLNLFIKHFELTYYCHYHKEINLSKHSDFLMRV